jgi:hypothetical protein
LWTDYFGLTPASSFLPVAVIFDLISYLRASGHLEHPRASNADPAVPLLHYTIPRKRCSNLLFNAYNLSNLKPRTVKLLLEAKESPNLPCPEVSPYQQALNFADHLCRSYDEKLKAFDILATMLYFGADPRVSGEVGQHIYPSTLIDDFYYTERNNDDQVRYPPTEVVALLDATAMAFESIRTRLETLFREEQLLGATGKAVESNRAGLETLSQGEQEKPKLKWLSIQKWIKRMKA